MAAAIAWIYDWPVDTGTISELKGSNGMISRTGLIAAALALPLSLSVAGCATPYASPVEVTRFIGNAPARLGSGTISVRPAPGAPGDTLEFAPYQQAVAAQLETLGYRVISDGVAAQVAEVRVGRELRTAAGRRGPVSVGVGGSTGSYGSGVGLGVGLDLTGAPKPVTDTLLGVIIRDNGTGQALWEGRASFGASSDSPYAQRQAAATRLATALFNGFPGQSGQTIEVK